MGLLHIRPAENSYCRWTDNIDKGGIRSVMSSGYYSIIAYAIPKSASQTNSPTGHRFARLQPLFEWETLVQRHNIPLSFTNTPASWESLYPSLYVQAAHLTHPFASRHSPFLHATPNAVHLQHSTPPPPPRSPLPLFAARAHNKKGGRGTGTASEKKSCQRDNRLSAQCRFPLFRRVE